MSDPTLQTPPKFIQPMSLAESIAKEAMGIRAVMTLLGLSSEGVGYDSAEGILVFPDVGRRLQAFNLFLDTTADLPASQVSYKGVEGIGLKLHFGEQSTKAKAA